MHRRGFSLLELAGVLAIIGVLSAVAVPTYRALTDRARALEPRTLLEVIANAELAHRRDVGAFVACPPNPPELPRQPQLFVAGQPGWLELGVGVDGPVRYRYQVKLEGDTFVAIAEGDLDADGVPSRFTLRGDTLRLTVEHELE